MKRKGDGERKGEIVTDRLRKNKFIAGTRGREDIVILS